jgi:hypothetical protein
LGATKNSNQQSFPRMNFKKIIFHVWLAASLLPLAAVAADDLTLKYAQPAARWTEALPVGNGRHWAWI